MEDTDFYVIKEGLFTTTVNVIIKENVLTSGTSYDIILKEDGTTTYTHAYVPTACNNENVK